MQLNFIAHAKSLSGRRSIESSSGRAALGNEVPSGSVAGHRLRSRSRRSRLSPSNWTIGVRLGIGRGRDRVLTCDLTKDYVAINGDYRS
jgi:N-acetylglutamate synthase/N-acetylornithine aminotransferase